MTTPMSSEHTTPLACVILAAGMGTRMKSNLPKVMHPIAGLPMIKHVIAACEALSPERIVVVTGPDMQIVREASAPHRCVVQKEPLGTGHAAKAAQEALADFRGDVLVLFGDTPLVTADSLIRLLGHRRDTGASIVVSAFWPENPGAYGRILTTDEGFVEAIVEAKDATPEQLDVPLCNGGIMLFDQGRFWPYLDALRNDNAKKEYYLTDCVAMAKREGLRVTAAEMSVDDVRGINTRVELAEVEAIMQKRLRERWMLAGVTMQDPASVFLCADTQFGLDVFIGANVVFGPGVSVGANVEIKPFTHLEQVEIASGATVGPFARLRPGAKIGSHAHIGNFVEIKNATIGAGAKVNHLSYIGDASIGEKTNIGAGTITCNYDGYTKMRTEIGAGAFIGSNTAFVAPVKIGDGASIGAGSTITKDVPPDALGVARAKQSVLEGWAARFRKRKEEA